MREWGYDVMGELREGRRRMVREGGGTGGWEYGRTGESGNGEMGYDVMGEWRIGE